MGKRSKKTQKPAGPKKKGVLASSFRCVFCNLEESVSVKMDKKNSVGNLSCKSCGQNFQTSIHNLSQPVDVYSDWIDACEAVANDQTTASTTAIGAPRPGGAAARRPRGREGLAPGEKYTDEDDGFIENDEVDAEAEYADE